MCINEIIKPNFVHSTSGLVYVMDYHHTQWITVKPDLGGLT